MTAINPRIGVIAEAHLHGHLLASTLREQGYDVAFNGSPARLFDAWWQQTIDLWLVDLQNAHQWQQLLDILTEKVSAPVLYSDGAIPPRDSLAYKRWAKRLLTKVSAYVGQPNPEAQVAAYEPVKLPPLSLPAPLQAVSEEPLLHVWSLGASLGGPAAVKLFLDRLPKETPVAFFLAQHIEPTFVEGLAQVLCRNNHFHCEVAKPGARLRHGQVLIAPTDYAIRFNEKGEVLATDKTWQGPYAPNINQAFEAVCKQVKAHHGIMMFSGMGDDGSKVTPQLARQGIPIWVQSPHTCAVSSQVDEVLKTGCVSLEAQPEFLAHHLLEYLVKQT